MRSRSGNASGHEASADIVMSPAGCRQRLISKTAAVLLCVFAAGAVPARGDTAACFFSAGDPFPEVVFQALLTPRQKEYLGIKTAPEFEQLYAFTLSGIAAELVIVEYLNVHCESCQAQAPVMNKVYNTIQADDHLRRQVRVMGVCPGNTFREISKFISERKVLFPLIPDPDFEAYDAVGGQCGTPFILMVRRGEKQRIITWSHRGQISSPLYFVQEAWDALETDLNLIVQKARAKSSIKLVIEKPQPFLSEDAMRSKIRSIVKNHKLTPVFIEKVILDGNDEIFITRVSEKGVQRSLFSKLISRNSVCDLCHAIHFILTFDEQGTIVDFTPLHITKYGNIEWTRPETEKINRKLVGTSLLAPRVFDPEVDAVSLATMSSALLYNSVNKSRSYYQQLQEKGYIPQ